MQYQVARCRTPQNPRIANGLPPACACSCSLLPAAGCCALPRRGSGPTSGLRWSGERCPASGRGRIAHHAGSSVRDSFLLSCCLPMVRSNEQAASQSRRGPTQVANELCTARDCVQHHETKHDPPKRWNVPVFGTLRRLMNDIDNDWGTQNSTSHLSNGIEIPLHACMSRKQNRFCLPPPLCSTHALPCACMRHDTCCTQPTVGFSASSPLQWTGKRRW